ncbi:MAG TPA: CheR family methyltransferase [Gaiellaceae bacterium]|nr:CheR family methyltransferase [Gaiellaceae bacterium]
MSPADALSRSTGIDLSAYRETHVAARVVRALEQEQVADVPRLARLLAADPAARDRFRRSVAVSVTGMFRDPEQFALLEQTLLPPLLADGRRLHVWSAGCSNGAELYSVALLLERLGALDRSFLLGSDLLAENVERARRADYTDAPVPPNLKRRLRWERRDLLSDGAPPGHWRLVLCRNVAIYLSPPAKDRLQETLAQALAPGGILLLGRSERVAETKRLGLERIGPHAYRKLAS